eukprot:TRINITY_DN1647_c0_g1_i1.p1 TRINITY_DN1647_c0_g1~~TRINITY_DN1647_c0_g1_i1.p1  ORF type:complete len:1265 (-),score=346.85 TRINITY_DN1647_c0_g1_i1:95-3889(-)
MPDYIMTMDDDDIDSLLDAELARLDSAQVPIVSPRYMTDIDEALAVKSPSKPRSTGYSSLLNRLQQRSDDFSDLEKLLQEVNDDIAADDIRSASQPTSVVSDTTVASILASVQHQEVAPHDDLDALRLAALEEERRIREEQRVAAATRELERLQREQELTQQQQERESQLQRRFQAEQERLATEAALEMQKQEALIKSMEAHAEQAKQLAAERAETTRATRELRQMSAEESRTRAAMRAEQSRAARAQSAMEYEESRTRRRLESDRARRETLQMTYEDALMQKRVRNEAAVAEAKRRALFTEKERARFEISMMAMEDRRAHERVVNELAVAERKHQEQLAEANRIAIEQGKMKLEDSRMTQRIQYEREIAAAAKRAAEAKRIELMRMTAELIKMEIEDELAHERRVADRETEQRKQRLLSLRAACSWQAVDASRRQWIVRVAAQQQQPRSTVVASTPSVVSSTAVPSVMPGAVGVTESVLKRGTLGVDPMRVSALDLSMEGLERMSGLQQMTSLVSLALNSNKIARLEGLSAHPLLTELSMKENVLGSMNGLQVCTSLTALTLDVNHLVRMEALDTCTALRTLSLQKNRITRITGLSRLAQLEKLILSANCIQRIEGLEALSSLQHLELSQNALTAVGGLSGCAQLRTLGLAHNQISAVPILDNVLLKSVSFSHNLLTTLPSLQWLPLLETLNVSDNKITEIDSLAACVSLTSINLSFNCIADLGMTALALSGCKRLQIVQLNDNPVAEVTGYRTHLMRELEALRELDHIPVTARERQLATSMAAVVCGGPYEGSQVWQQSAAVNVAAHAGRYLQQMRSGMCSLPAHMATWNAAVSSHSDASSWAASAFMQMCDQQRAELERISAETRKHRDPAVVSRRLRLLLARHFTQHLSFDAAAWQARFTAIASPAEQSARTIQRYWRRFHVHTTYIVRQHQLACATSIQALARGFLIRKRLAARRIQLQVLLNQHTIDDLDDDLDLDWIDQMPNFDSPRRPELSAATTAAFMRPPPQPAHVPAWQQPPLPSIGALGGATMLPPPPRYVPPPAVAGHHPPQPYTQQQQPPMSSYQMSGVAAGADSAVPSSPGSATGDGADGSPNAKKKMGQKLDEIAHGWSNNPAVIAAARKRAQRMLMAHTKKERDARNKDPMIKLAKFQKSATRQVSVHGVHPSVHAHPPLPMPQASFGAQPTAFASTPVQPPQGAYTDRHYDSDTQSITSGHTAHSASSAPAPAVLAVQKRNSAPQVVGRAAATMGRRPTGRVNNFM